MLPGTRLYSAVITEEDLAVIDSKMAGSSPSKRFNTQVESHEEQMMEMTEEKIIEREVAAIDRTIAGATAEDRILLLGIKRRLEENLSEKNENGGMRKSVWLKQVLPTLRVECRTKASCREGKYDKFVAESVKLWENFPLEAMEYGEEEIITGVSLMSSQTRSMLGSKTVGSNASAGFAMLTVLEYVRLGPYRYWKVAEQPRSSSTFEGEGGDSSSKAGSADSKARRIADSPNLIEPDMLVKKGNRAVLSIEMKPPAAFRGEGNEAVDLVESYHDASSANGRLHRECVSQLMSYMVNLNTCYGILSSAEFTYFGRRVPKDDNHYSSLEISKSISFDGDGPTLLESLFFILDKSTKSASDTKYGFKETDAPDYNEDSAKDDSPKNKAKKRRTSKIHQRGTRTSLRIQSRSAVNYCDLQDTAASNLQLEKRPYFSRGWSGKIGIGLINGQQVAVKIARKYTKKAEALLKEMTAYKMLERYWGRYVPELVKYGTTVNRTLVFIATKFIKGSEIWRRAPSQAEWMAAEEALYAIHCSGLLHGDIHGGNIMVVEGGGVQFIDFGFSKFITNQGDCSKELNQLKRILENCTSTVTQC